MHPCHLKTVSNGCSVVLKLSALYLLVYLSAFALAEGPVNGNPGKFCT